MKSSLPKTNFSEKVELGCMTDLLALRRVEHIGINVCQSPALVGTVEHNVKKLVIL